MNNKKHFILIFGLMLAGVLFLATGVLAKDAGETPFDFTPQVGIPGTDFAGEVDNVRTGDAIATYIISLYRYGAGIAGLVALFMVVLAGWKWLMAAGSSEKISQAKDTIQGAVIGLFLLFGGYLLLSQISENLVSFDTLKIISVEPIPLSQSTCDAYKNKEECVAHSMCDWKELADGNITGLIGVCVLKEDQICPADSQVRDISVSGNVRVTASDPRLIPAANTSLQIAVSSLTSDEFLTVTSAYRSWDLQQTLYECYINSVNGVCPDGCRSCNEAAKPNCDAPHQTGLAVDVCYQNSEVDTCTNEIMTKTYNCIGSSTPPCTAAISQAQTRLRDIMMISGFDPYVGEWWHFQL